MCIWKQVTLWINSEEGFWTCYGKFAKLALELYDSTELGLLRVRKTPLRKLLCSPRSGLLRRLVEQDFKTREMGFNYVMENQQSGA